MVPRALTLIVAVAITALQGVPLASQAPPAAPAARSAAAFLDAPFGSSLVASPAGARVAWVFDAAGARNIWVAEGPAFAGRALTTYAGDNGQEITNLQWTPDGQQIVYVRGGGPNRAGELPNPTSDVDGVEQAVWIVPAAGGAPRKLGAGDAPAVSPRGDLVAFVQRGQVWTAGVSGTPAAAPLMRTRGSARSLTFSPDGSQLAFVSARGTHAYIGVYDLASRALRYLDPSVDSDAEPAWSPDGRSLAFVRQAADSGRISFHPVREGEPWSIRVVDVGTGAAREVWRAARG
ncbi:MAG: S9 family peptidase, partial [Acidobacteriota bacterium]